MFLGLGWCYFGWRDVPIIRCCRSLSRGVRWLGSKRWPCCRWFCYQLASVQFSQVSIGREWSVRTCKTSGSIYIGRNRRLHLARCFAWYWRGICHVYGSVLLRWCCGAGWWWEQHKLAYIEGMAAINTLILQMINNTTNTYLERSFCLRKVASSSATWSIGLLRNASIATS